MFLDMGVFLRMGVFLSVGMFLAMGAFLRKSGSQILLGSHPLCFVAMAEQCSVYRAAPGNLCSLQTQRHTGLHRAAPCEATAPGIAGQLRYKASTGEEGLPEGSGDQ